MDNTIKTSKRAIHNYTFGHTTINLNGYQATCTVTGLKKRFYHSYLANLIKTKYDDSLQTFESTYVSRAGRTAAVPHKKAKELQSRIDRMYAQIRILKDKKASLVTTA